MEERATQNVLAIVEELLAQAEAAKKVPLTNRVMLDQDELLDLLERLRDELPDEITQARWLMRDRDKVILQARTDAERILREAAARAEEMSRESAITQVARKHAEDVVEQARQIAKEIRVGANEYADGLLLRVQESLATTLRAVESARGELRTQVAAGKAPEKSSGGRGSRGAAGDDGAAVGPPDGMDRDRS